MAIMWGSIILTVVVLAAYTFCNYKAFGWPGNWPSWSDKFTRD